jgi:Flp pilus assembly pilin Flp
MLLRTIGRLRGLLRDDNAQDIMEYALLASLIAVALIGALRAAGTGIDSLWSDIATGIAIF